MPNHTSSGASSSRTPHVDSSNIKPLRDKRGACANCRGRPTEGTTFRACAACKIVLYCSKECQKVHWAEHRERCKNFQLLNEPDAATRGSHPATAQDYPSLYDPSWPPALSTKDRAVVMNNFCELHDYNISMSVELLRHALQRHGQDLNGLRHAFAITLGYRADCDGNPATRLIVRRVELVEVAKLRLQRPRAHNSETHHGNSRGHQPDEPAKDKLAVTFRGGGAEVTAWVTLDAADSELSEEKAKLDMYPMDWITNLRYMTAAGLLMDKAGAAPATAWLMRKKGTKWRRVQITDKMEPFEVRMGPEPEVVMGSLSRWL